MKDLEKIIKALANRRRLAIIKFISTQREASVGDIAGHLRLSIKATSKHLSVLGHADILDKEQKSKQVYYFLASPSHSLIRHVLSLF